MEIKKQYPIDLPSKPSVMKFLPGISVMDDFKRSKSPLGRCLEKRQWSSETDIPQSSLPPISSNDTRKNNNYKWIPNNSSGKQLYSNRPATPSPGRNPDSVFSFGRTSRISPSNLSHRLSLSLDLRPIIGGVDLRRHSAGFADSSPEVEYSPRLCARSLPSSPRLHRNQRIHHRNLRRMSSDSEQGDSKEDRIINWIRDVSEKTQGHSQTQSFNDDEETLFDYPMEKNDDLGFNSVNGLPVIQEGRKT